MANRPYLFGIDNLPTSYKDRPSKIFTLGDYRWSMPLLFLLLVSANPRRVAALCAEGSEETGPIYAIAGDKAGGIANLRKYCQLTQASHPNPGAFMAQVDAAEAWLNQWEFPYIFLEHFELDEMNYDGSKTFFEQENHNWLRHIEQLATLISTDASIEQFKKCKAFDCVETDIENQLPIPDKHNGSFTTASFFAPLTARQTEQEAKLQEAHQVLGKIIQKMRPTIKFRLRDLFHKPNRADCWQVVMNLKTNEARFRAFAGDKMEQDEPLPDGHEAVKLIREQIEPAYKGRYQERLGAINAVARLTDQKGFDAKFRFQLFHSLAPNRWQTPLPDAAENRALMIENDGRSFESQRSAAIQQAQRQQLSALLAEIASTADSIVVAMRVESAEPAIMVAFNAETETLLHRGELPVDHPVCTAMRDELAPLDANSHLIPIKAIALTMRPHSRPEKYPPRIQLLRSDNPSYWHDVLEGDHLFRQAFHPPSLRNKCI